MVFVKEEILHKKIQKKDVSWFDHKLTDRKVVRNSVEAYEGYKVIEKFDKVFLYYLKIILGWLLPKNLWF